MFKKQNLILITIHYQTSCQAIFSAIFSVLTGKKMAACHMVTGAERGVVCVGGEFLFDVKT